MEIARGRGLKHGDKDVGVVELLAEKQDADRNFYSPMASFQINSDSLKDMERLCGLLEELFPIVVVSALLVGMFGHSIVIMQSTRDAVLLRVLGVTKKRVRCMLVLGQVFLCLTGVLIVAGGLCLYSPGLFLKSSDTLAACFVPYFIGCVLSVSIAAVQVTRHRILELLQVRE